VWRCYLTLRLIVGPVKCRPVNCRRLTVAPLSVARWSVTKPLLSAVPLGTYTFNLNNSCTNKCDKSSPVAKMGDRGHNRGGCCALFAGGAGSPSNKMWPRLRPIPPYQVASLCIQPFCHNRNWALGGLCHVFGEGELGSHLAQYGLGLGPHLCQVPSWSIQPFGHNRHELKIGGSVPFLGRGSWEHIRQTGRTGQTDGSDRTTVR